MEMNLVCENADNATQVCKECERELPLGKFRIAKGGARCSVCNDCATAKRRVNKQLRIGGGINNPVYDAEFEGKQPVEVIQLMSRAKRWLEGKGYEITLRGRFTITKEVKF